MRKDIVEFENFVNETVKYTLDQYKDVEYTIKGEEQYISINQISIQMVLVNILKNAVESFENNKGKIDIEVKQDGENIHLKVKDNGSGIKKELFEKIMEPTFTTKADGTGLGLFECKIIIEKHRGKFYFESDVGVGSTFYVVLPRE